MPELEYMSAHDAAEKWGISQRRISVLCSEKRIDGIARLGNMWLIPSDAEKPCDKRKKNAKINAVKPFLKWAGGKGQLLETLRDNYPKGMGSSITRYCEPMVGGGAVLFDMLQNYYFDEVMICDCNFELVNCYKQIKSNVSDLITSLQKMQDKYISLDVDKRKEYFYAKRSSFNAMKSNRDNTLELAAHMIFLNKTCFNGLYRVNRKGEYNVPMGDYKNPKICDADNLMSVSRALQKVEIKCGTYEDTIEFIDENTFVYIDPPYRPISKTASFTSYSETEFDDIQQEKLSEFVNMISLSGAKVMESNSDPKNVNDEDNFFDDLYSAFNIKRIQAKRSINSKGAKRGNISELLIKNY